MKKFIYIIIFSLIMVYLYNNIFPKRFVSIEEMTLEDKNIVNKLPFGNAFCSDGEYLYAINNIRHIDNYGDFYIYKKNLENNQITLLAIENNIDVKNTNIYIYKNIIYYSDKDGTIKCISKDGGEVKEIIETNTDYPDVLFYVYNNSIYYQTIIFSDNTSKYEIYRCDLDGLNKENLFTYAITSSGKYADFNIYNNYIYCYIPYNVENMIYDLWYKINLNTKKISYIDTAKDKTFYSTYNYFIRDNRLYFFAEKTESDKRNLYYMDLTTNEISMIPYIGDMKFNLMTIDGEWIYFSYDSETHKMKMDGSEIIKIFDSHSLESEFNVIDGKLYSYAVSVLDNYEISTDGSGEYRDMLFYTTLEKSKRPRLYTYKDMSYINFSSIEDGSYHNKVAKKDLITGETSIILDYELQNLIKPIIYFDLYENNIYYSIVEYEGNRSDIEYDGAFYKHTVYNEVFYKYNIETNELTSILNDELKNIKNKISYFRYEDKIYFLTRLGHDTKIYHMDLNGNNITQIGFYEHIQGYVIKDIDDKTIYFTYYDGIYEADRSGNLSN